MDSVKEALFKTKTDIAMIPGGLTSVLQPLESQPSFSKIPFARSGPHG